MRPMPRTYQNKNYAYKQGTLLTDNDLKDNPKYIFICHCVDDIDKIKDIMVYFSKEANKYISVYRRNKVTTMNKYTQTILQAKIAAKRWFSAI
jgi:hypothetical protein